MNKKTVLPELLAPAGNFEKMEAAFRFGADAVYLAGSRFGMRAGADNFSNLELFSAVEFAHKNEKKVYLTLNVMPREDDFLALEEYLEMISEVKPDAVIVADLGVLRLCKKKIENIPIHISTQAATVNSHSCNMWYDLGAKRIVLARELSLRDIEAIKKNIPDDLELETFVHGSMCVSFSGRCMLSEYFTGRDANRGACTQPCRWQYRFYEEKRPDDVLTCEIYPEGSYIFGSKDLCMIEHLKELCDVGVDSLKIEGRMKSAYYTAVVSNAYRIALKNGSSADIPSLVRELESVSHREFCTGYFFDPKMQNSHFASNSGYIGEQSFLCSVLDFNENDSIAKCRQKNKFSVGENCEFLTPGLTGQHLDVLQMFDDKMNPIESCQHPQMVFYIKTNQRLHTGDIIRKRY